MDSNTAQCKRSQSKSDFNYFFIQISSCFCGQHRKKKFFPLLLLPKKNYKTRSLIKITHCGSQQLNCKTIINCICCMSLQTSLIHLFNVGNCELIYYMQLSGNLPDLGSYTWALEKLFCRVPAPPVVPGKFQTLHTYLCWEQLAALPLTLAMCLMSVTYILHVTKNNFQCKNKQLTKYLHKLWLILLSS